MKQKDEGKKNGGEEIYATNNMRGKDDKGKKNERKENKRKSEEEGYQKKLQNEDEARQR